MTEKRKKLLIRIAAGAILVAVLCVGVWFIQRQVRLYKIYHVEPLTSQRMEAAGVSNANKLMIVAHPDDETLWGGGHLKDGGYFVVCITGGRNKARAQEFLNVVEASGNEGIMLEYPDKVMGKRDDWSKVSGSIKADIKTVMEQKKWELIVTHNKDGEYGHQHHKLIHGYVTEIYDNNKFDSPLYCFGKYYKRSVLDDSVKSGLTEMSQDRIEFKEKLEELYLSQSKVVENLSHMNHYEMWEQYSVGAEQP